MKFSFGKIKELFKGALAKKEELLEKKEKQKQQETISTAVLADDAEALISSLCEELGPRPAASRKSRQAARKIASLYEEYTEDVTLTSSRVYIGIMKGMGKIAMITSGLMFLPYIINLPILSLALFAFYIYCLLAELQKKKNYLRSFIYSDDACNVHGVLEPEEEVKRTIIFSSHHDSGEVEKKDKGFDNSLISYVLPIVAISLLALCSIVLMIVSLVKGYGFGFPPLWLALLGLIGPIMAAVCYVIQRRTVIEFSPGAGDNLSGVAVTVELLRYFKFQKNHGKGLKNTRLVFASFDAEEYELQGSEAWYEKHPSLIENAENINFDGLFKADDIVFLTTDGNGVVPLSRELASRCASILSSMGYKTEFGALGMMAGETDAAAASKAGLSATTMTSMRPEIKTPAHSLEDTPDKVEKKALLMAISLGIKYAESVDSASETILIEEDKASFLSSEKKYKLTR